MNDLLLSIRFAVETSNVKISRRHWANHVKNYIKEGLILCRTIVLLHLTSHISDFYTPCSHHLSVTLIHFQAVLKQPNLKSCG